VYLARDIVVVVLAYATLHAIALQLAFVGVTTAIARRYPGASGLALGVAYAGQGVGVAVALPLAGRLIESAGWRAASLAFLAAAVVGTAFVWLMTSGPEILVPARRTPTTDSSEATIERGPDTSADRAVAAGGKRHHGAIHTRRFWALFAGAVGIGFFDEGVFLAFVPNAVRLGLDVGFASAALGAQAFAWVVGQVLGGGLSDRFGRRAVGVTAAVVVAASVAAAFSAGSRTIVLVGIVGHGFGTGATIAIRSATFSDIFGGTNFGTIFGLLGVAYPIGGAIGVYAGAIAVDRLGTYTPLVAVAIAAAAGWALILWVGGPRGNPGLVSAGGPA
jgi:MFS family permease